MKKSENNHQFKKKLSFCYKGCEKSCYKYFFYRTLNELVSQLLFWIFGKN